MEKRRDSLEIPPDYDTGENAFGSFFKSFRPTGHLKLRDIEKKLKKNRKDVESMQERTYIVRTAGTVLSGTAGATAFLTTLFNGGPHFVSAIAAAGVSIFGLASAAGIATGAFDAGAGAAVVSATAAGASGTFAFMGAAAGLATAGSAASAATALAGAAQGAAASVGFATAAAVGATGTFATVFGVLLTKLFMLNTCAKALEKQAKEFMNIVKPLKDKLEEICKKTESAEAKQILADVEQFEKLLNQISGLRENSWIIDDGKLVMFCIQATEQSKKIIDQCEEMANNLR